MPGRDQMAGLDFHSIDTYHSRSNAAGDHRGNSSEVEHQLPKLRVAGSNPVSRSIVDSVHGDSEPPTGAVSSVGLERLPYKQEVAGSNPAPPTIVFFKPRLALATRGFLLV